MPKPPALTAEQRRTAFERSLELRRQRADLKHWITLNPRRLPVAWEFEAAQGMKVLDLLTALPYVGETKAETLMQRAKIPLKNTVRATGLKQRERLFSLLEKRKPRR